MAARTRRTAERREPVVDVAPAQRRRSDPSGPRRQARGRRGGGSRLGRILYWGVVASLWCVIAGIGVLFWVASHLPPIESLEVPKRPPSVQILAIDDRRFYHHFGVDPIGLVRAVAANVLHRGVTQGGSTITQQLAKNLFLTP